MKWMGTWVLFFGLGFAAWAQAPVPAPTPAEQELQKPLQMDDGKPASTNSPAESGASGFRAVGSLFLVLGLAGGALYALRRWGGSKVLGIHGGKLKLEDTLNLGERRTIAILKAEEERLVIALTPQGIQLIARLGPNLEEETSAFNHQLHHEAQRNTPIPLKEMEARWRETNEGEYP